MIEIAQYKHVVWDWNGTLFNDAWLCVDAMNQMLTQRGMEGMTHERYQKVFDFPVMGYYERLGFDFEKESFEALGDEFMKDYEARRTECALQDGALDTLTFLHSSGKSQSILSAYKQETLLELLHHFDIRQHFTHVIGQEDHYATGKAEQGLSWIENMHVRAEEVLLVGDTVHDHEVAELMGTDCALVFGGNHTVERLSTCGVPVFPSLLAFLDAIR